MEAPLDDPAPQQHQQVPVVVVVVVAVVVPAPLAMALSMQAAITQSAVPLRLRQAAGWYHFQVMPQRLPRLAAAVPALLRQQGPGCMSDTNRQALTAVVKAQATPLPLLRAACWERASQPRCSRGLEGNTRRAKGRLHQTV